LLMTRQPSGVYGGGTADESAATAQTPLSETGASRCRPVIPGRVLLSHPTNAKIVATMNRQR